MAYQIIEGNIVSRDTQGTTRKFIKRNVDIIIAECKRQGITNKYLIAAILATISKESQFIPQNENLSYSIAGLKKTFGKYFGQGKANPDDFSKKPEKLANYVYGNKYGNKEPGDGWKFRGRGFNQITFKGNYDYYKSLIPNIINSPDLLNQLPEASIAAVSFYVREFKNNKIKKNYGKLAYDVSDWNEALLIVINATAGLNNPKTSDVVKYNYDKAKLSHGFLIDYLEKNPEGTTVPPTNPSDIQNQDNDSSQEPIPSEYTDDSEQSDSDISNSSDTPISSLTQIFPPTLNPLEITFNTEDFKVSDKAKFEKGLGFLPFVWYNGVQIDTKDVLNFKLYHNGILPTIDILFRDSYSFFREDGFPTDDSFITIYLNSRSINLRSIHMDFKIYDFKDIGDGTYRLTGICDIPQLYLRKFNSYSDKTSHETLQELSRQMEIGFCSNINSSSDKMTWINPGFKNIDFIQSILNNSYVSDTSFQYCYIDFYYNLCYVDVNKEINRDVSNDQMVNGFGNSLLKDVENSDTNDESLLPMSLTNDPASKESVSYFNNYDIFNKSTRVSIDKSFRSRSKFYDSIKKEILVFDIESQTSDGSKSIILKGKANDTKMFNENTSTIWLGKQDNYNVHDNYNYSVSQNRQNLDDLTKISCKIKLPSCNYNLYLFQKILLVFVDIKPSPVNDSKFLKRFTGDWLITNIDFIYDAGKISQTITLVKRELGLSPNESDNYINKPVESDNSDNFNELSPND